MKGHACAVRTNPPKKLLWLVFYFVTCSAIEGPYCSTSQKFSHQNKQAQEACNTGISVFFPFTLSNNWSLLFLGIATYNKKTRNYLKLHIFQDVFPSQLCQLFCPESQIPYTVTLFHSHLRHESSQCQQPRHANDCKRFRVCLWKSDWLNNDKGRKKFYEVTLTFPQKATSEGRKTAWLDTLRNAFKFKLKPDYCHNAFVFRKLSDKLKRKSKEMKCGLQ